MLTVHRIRRGPEEKLKADGLQHSYSLTRAPEQIKKRNMFSLTLRHPFSCLFTQKYMSYSSVHSTDTSFFFHQPTKNLYKILMSNSQWDDSLQFLECMDSQIFLSSFLNVSFFFPCIFILSNSSSDWQNIHQPFCPYGMLMNIRPLLHLSVKFLFVFSYLAPRNSVLWGVKENIYKIMLQQSPHSLELKADLGIDGIPHNGAEVRQEPGRLLTLDFNKSLLDFHFQKAGKFTAFIYRNATQRFHAGRLENSFLAKIGPAWHKAFRRNYSSLKSRFNTPSHGHVSHLKRLYHHAKFDVKICQVFLSLMSQAPFCCGLSQVLVGPDEAQWMSHGVSHFYLSLFPECIIWFQRLPHLFCLFVMCRYYDSHPIPSILSEDIFQSHNLGWMRFLINFSTAWFYKTNTKLLSPQGSTIAKCTQCNLKHPSGSQYLTGLLHSSTCSGKQTHLRPLKQESPSHPPCQLKPHKLPFRIAPPPPIFFGKIMDKNFEWCLSISDYTTADSMLSLSHLTHNLTPFHPACFDMEFGMVHGPKMGTLKINDSSMRYGFTKKSLEILLIQILLYQGKKFGDPCNYKHQGFFQHSHALLNLKFRLIFAIQLQIFFTNWLDFIPWLSCNHTCCDSVLTVVLRAVSLPCYHDVWPYIMVKRCQLQQLDTVALADLKIGLGESGSRIGSSSNKEKRELAFRGYLVGLQISSVSSCGWVNILNFTVRLVESQAAELNKVVKKYAKVFLATKFLLFWGVVLVFLSFCDWCCQD
ncbi:hypothetical protein VP01_384g1 [Puccinia sorghi]|uniref:Uncharacterized protein n=1 Tax=Puccinia sorghi TaxID=27349 RepID=A0A0L6UTY5_9BASI|nr:hypothetical protein VP01_384g1 [Puccinia sorghi]